MVREIMNKNGNLPKFVETNCTRQKNSNDCGLFIIYQIWKMLYYIRNGTRFFVQGATLGIDEMNMTQQLCHMILQEINKHNHNTDTTLIKGGKELSFENPKIDKVVTMQKTTNETEKEDKNETNINKIIGEKIERTK